MRLAKYLAHAGVASRRAAEDIVRAGRVSVAGETVTDPARDVDSDSAVAVDGELAHRLTHPSFEVPKTYRAKVRGRPTDDDIRRLREGVELDDGPTARARVRRVGAELEIVIHEGRKRQVRRMLEAVGHPAIELRRIAFGPLHLGNLAPGAARRLRKEEVERLSGRSAPPPRRGPPRRAPRR